ncbi:Olfactory marker protein [Liparis tanakae]|uniref:Olfactory marker protein n=1 Tax=Liparis tanakae TaxID=230148 RepID=A0A4Z2H7W3_9TELE|nr:Olfactory marker protein [Liparis tanakae]
MSAELELPFRQDGQLTELMRLRVQSLHQRGAARQDGERLLLPNEAVYRLDFSQQSLGFSRWTVALAEPGRLSVTAISQLWTPDLTHLMTRQLLEPVGVFWRAAGGGGGDDAPVQRYEADAHEFGERIAELAKVRKAMYFLFAYADGCSPQTVDCSITFTRIFPRWTGETGSCCLIRLPSCVMTVANKEGERRADLAAQPPHFTGRRADETVTVAVEEEPRVR